VYLGHTQESDTAPWNVQQPIEHYQIIHGINVIIHFCLLFHRKTSGESWRSQI